MSVVDQCSRISVRAPSHSEKVGAQRVPARRPLVGIALAFMAGIVADRTFGIPLLASISVLGAALVLWLVCLRRGWMLSAKLALYAAVLAVAAARHQQRTNLFPAGDIGNFASIHAGLARIRGRLVAEPVCHSPSTPGSAFAWRRSESTTTLVDVEQIYDYNHWVSATGRLALRVAGKLPDIWSGDRIEVIGWLNRPAPPRNPGELDYAHYLMQRRVRATLFCEHPGALVRLGRPPAISPSGWRERLRRAAGRHLHDALGPEEACIAEAILLGKRSAVERQQIGPFLRSGTLHLLVVSGLHLVIVARILWQAAAALRLSLRAQALVVLAAVIGITYFTGGNPPVVRAAIVVGLFMGSYVLDRPVQPVNSLAGAVLVVLGNDPTDLFRGGPQLSFVSVMAIILFYQPLSAWLLPASSRQQSQKQWRLTSLQHLLKLLLVSLVIALVSAPLIACRFHLWSPISVLLSPLLIPLLMLAVVSGSLFLITIPLSKGIALFLSLGCQASLNLMWRTVQSVEHWPIGFTYLPPLPHWWVLGFYVTLLLPACVSRQRFGKGSVSAVMLWLTVGGAIMCLPRRHRDFEYHQLAVGHGNCAVLVFPTGHTVLRDCGSLSGPLLAERTVAPWLWSRRIGAVDAVFLSHADVDHFSGLAELARRIPLRVVYLTVSLATADGSTIREIRRQLLDLRVPMRIVWAGDCFRIGETTLTVVQPAVREAKDSDNSNSMVLHCQAGEYTFLLTGDLEGHGLTRLLNRPLGRVDVLIAPHHGSRRSNTVEVAGWARPRLVISSQGPQRSTTDHLDVYRQQGALVLRTHEEGAISCRIASEGLEVHTFYTNRRYLLRR